MNNVCTLKNLTSVSACFYVSKHISLSAVAVVVAVDVIHGDRLAENYNLISLFSPSKESHEIAIEWKGSRHYYSTFDLGNCWPKFFPNKISINTKRES